MVIRCSQLGEKIKKNKLRLGLKKKKTAERNDHERAL